MSSNVQIFLIVGVSVFAAMVAVFLMNKRARVRGSAIDHVDLDLGGRVPAQRRRPCGRRGGESGGNCGDCEHKHEHHDEHGHGEDEKCAGHCKSE